MPEKRSHAKKLNCSSTKITKKLGTAKTKKRKNNTGEIHTFSMRKPQNGWPSN